MNIPTTSEKVVNCNAPNLKFLCVRAVCIALFQTNIRWRQSAEVARNLTQWLREANFPKNITQQLQIGLAETFREVQRWGEKHVQLFPDQNTRSRGSRIPRVHRGEHLRLFYGCISWRPCSFEINDYKTARRIIFEECSNWSQMQFQFACAYAMFDLLKDDGMFDKVRFRAFKKQLSGHCLYDFWLEILTDSATWDRIFRSDALAPKQRVSLVFQYSIVHGYFELMKFIWDRVTEPQREYIGMLQWRRLCFKAQHGPMLRFLCSELCRINSSGLAHITWNTFYHALYTSIQEEFHDEELRNENLRKIEFLLDNCCPILRKLLLSMENFKAVTEAFTYKQTNTFSLFLDYLNGEQLKSAREFVDRIYDRKKNDIVRGFRQMVVRRQNTIE
ncbi:hypothetical protein AB6A40_004126 [Gnathostoma spinigerum]|uniref:Uncharacterized protein n=1 Tax=Gnathostoma spinigerum TaxID=75299 RepID=A0ABD6EL34_9BILA